MSKLFVGIDVSKNSFDVCSINEEEKVVFNDKLNIDHNGFNNLLSKLKEYKIDDTIIVMESTAIYHLTLLSFLLTHNYKTAVINPFLIKSFIESNTLRKSKSDKKDALHIAKFALAKYKNISFYNIDSLESIKPLLREKENIVKDAGRAKTSIKNMVRNFNQKKLPKICYNVH
jgi:transposase